MVGMGPLWFALVGKVRKWIHASVCFGGKIGQSCAVDVIGCASLLITLD